MAYLQNKFYLEPIHLFLLKMIIGNIEHWTDVEHWYSYSNKQLQLQ